MSITIAQFALDLDKIPDYMRDAHKEDIYYLIKIPDVFSINYVLLCHPNNAPEEFLIITKRKLNSNYDCLSYEEIIGLIYDLWSGIFQLEEIVPIEKEKIILKDEKFDLNTALRERINKRIKEN